jgi:hypothetical protein
MKTLSFVQFENPPLPANPIHMENRVKVLLTTVLLTATGFVHAQTASAVFDPKVPVTWLGLDFYGAKFVGDQAGFVAASRTKNLLASWNELLLKEAAKYNPGRALRKKNVTNDFSATNQHNEALDFNSMLSDKAGDPMDKATVRSVVAGYDFGGLSGLGMMLKVESFDMSTEKGTFWVTFINLSTKQVIFTERMSGPPKGFGIRNYWAGSISFVLDRMDKEVTVWRKKYKDNDTESVYDGPIVQNIASTRETSTPEPTAAVKKTTEATTTNKNIKPGGKYYALLIGVSKYSDSRLNLDQPVSDARKIKEVLTQGYDFNTQNTILLENPSRGEIFSALYKLRNQVTSSDNLLIFYAGHGYWDEKIKQGYWWPRDATAADPSNWLSNSDLREQLRGISSAHTLLVSDACFSGGIFRTRDANSIKNASMDYQMLYKMPSRRAMTSGTLTAVPDRSVFVEYFVKRLGQNQEKFLPSQSLFNSIRAAIINNSATVPQEGVIAETGDEGGDFIFQKK